MQKHQKDPEPYILFHWMYWLRSLGETLDLTLTSAFSKSSMLTGLT